MTRYERCLKRIKKERKQRIINTIGVILFYVFFIIGVLLIDARYDDLCNQGYTKYCDIEKGE